MNYVPLWVKTDYTILSSLIKIDDLINKLLALDIKCAAICDDNLFGAVEFYDKCNKNGIKPIIGLEVNLDFTILLYAQNYQGYQSLCKIDTLKNRGLLTFEVLSKILGDLIIVIPYEHKEHQEEMLSYSDKVFIGYQNEEEAQNLKGNKVYIKKCLSLTKIDETYLPYLYKIKDEEYDDKQDVTLDEGVSPSFKKDTIYFGNLCNLKIPKRDDLLPIYNEEPSFNASEYLTNLCVFGLRKRLDGNVSKTYLERLKYELNVIIKMGFCNYFLVVWDYVKHAKKNNILVGPGRGSVASSLVSYSLGITEVDPLKYDLLFERFLNPERVTMPDIDIDFDAERRHEVINYVIDKYGKERVCGIITFSNLLAKQVIRDLARIFEISTYKIDSLLNNFDDKKGLKEQLQNINVKKILSGDEDLKKLYDVAMHLEGLKRHSSVHAAGIVISNKELSNYVPLVLNSDGSYLCGYTMNYIEELGLLKMDFLGLKNLTIIYNVIKKIPGLKFNEIPLDDKKTFELFSKGDLDGVFQFETPGMRKFIVELKPDNINDLIAAVALFRPGPIDNIPNYIERKQGRQKITYLHEDLKEILSPTYGIIVYQEQIMQIASKMAGFSYGEADVLRRAMSKKKEDVLINQKQRFINGSIAKGYDEKTAESVYNLILKFANYGFNKAHSVSYALVGYKIAYLKAHYSLIFMREILNNYVGVTSKTKNLINECKKLGIIIIKPAINSSTCEYELKVNEIEYPLSMIKGIGTLTCRQIVQERNQNGFFKSYLDFVRRTYKLGKDVLKALALSGALDEFKLTRKSMIKNLDDAVNYAELCADLDEKLVAKPEIKEFLEYPLEELTKQEQQLYGFYISNHPTNKYVGNDDVTTDKLGNYFDKNVKITLLFERKKEIDTKGGEKMMFINASDSFGQVEVVMFPKTYNKFFNVPFPGIYEVVGKVEKRFSKLQIAAYDIKKLN